MKKILLFCFAFILAATSNVVSQPVLEVNPASLDFGSEVTILTFAIANSGNGTLSWNISVDQDWILVNPTSGSTTAETDAIEVTVNRDYLKAGFHEGHIEVTSTGGDCTVYVQLEVGQTLKVNPDSLVFGIYENMLPLEITNIGYDTLEWKIIVDEQWWIAVNPRSGIIPPAKTNSSSVTVTRYGFKMNLTKGYSGEIKVISNWGDTALVNVNMKVPNYKPYIVTLIPDTSLSIDSPAFQKNLNTVFADSNKDVLKYSTNSSNTNVAISAIADDSTLFIFIKNDASDGETSKTLVNAADPEGAKNSFEFKVTASMPPVIEILSIEPSPPIPIKSNIVVSANITDAQSVDRVKFNFRKGGDTGFVEFLDATSEGSYYEFTIPDSMATDRGIEYFLTAMDALGLVSRLPKSGVFSHSIRISGEGLIMVKPYPSGSEQNAYRMISVPLDLDNRNPGDVLEDDLGKYDNTKWRFYELQSNQQYIEYPNTSDMIPGKAFWLIVKESGKVINTGVGNTNITSQEYAIPLNPGWNLIGNPFNFPIPIENVYMQSNNKTLDLFLYDRSWTVLYSNDGNVMKPFEGYAVFNDSSFVDILRVNPDLSSKPKHLLKEMKSFKENKKNWEIQIKAQCQDARDIYNIAAVSSAASQAKDQMDKPEPPVIGEYVSVYFPHPEWGKITSQFCVDTRPEPLEGDIWEFEVKTNIHDKAKLSFNGIENVPLSYDVWLVDEALKITKNLRKTNEYFVAGPSEDNPKRLKLLVGKENFIKEQIAEIELIPTSCELFQNFPNPFNPATTIRYGLPKEERVTLVIYNLHGQEVSRLVNYEMQEGGYHIAIWDGRNFAGDKIASGIYIYRIQTRNFTQYKKMILVK